MLKMECTLLTSSGKILKKDLEISRAANSGMVLKPSTVLLTEANQWELRIDFQFENHTRSYLHYNVFRVGTESEGYPLTIGGFTGITPTDPFATHPLNGQRFSTFDNDNDRGNANCAAAYDSGWWYNNCRHINANRQPPFVYFHPHRYGLISMEMKIRPRDCIAQ